MSRIIRREISFPDRILEKSNDLAISVITEAEILCGIRKKPEATRLAARVKEVLPLFSKLSWTSQTASTYASLRIGIAKRGISISLMDLLIAAHSLEHGRVLVTSDAALHQLNDLLPVENWI